MRLHLSCLQVDDPSKYGVIILDEYGRVQQFVEKPKVRHTCTWGWLSHDSVSSTSHCCLGTAGRSAVTAYLHRLLMPVRIHGWCLW